MRKTPASRASDYVGLAWVLTFSVTLLSSPAFAQDVRQTDVSAGYLNVNGSMHGWNVQLTAPVSSRWSLIAELDGSRGHDPGSDDYTYRDFAFLGGVRFGWQPTPRISPFWQVLAGGLNSKAAGGYCTITGRCVRDEFSVNYFALQPGGGVTVMVTPRFGIRAQADMQLAIPDQSQYEGMTMFPRVVTGAVIRLGRGL